MKLAECLLQDRPIRRKNFSQWCKPEIVMSNLSSHAALPTVCGTDKYLLDYTNMTADDWEIKPMTLGEKILEIMKDHTRSADKALCDIRYIIESGNYEE